MKILLNIDTQYDFIYPFGNLYVPNAEKIVPNLKKIFKHAKKKFQIISTMDLHTQDSQEFKKNGGEFEEHCLQGTLGQRLIPETMLEDNTTLFHYEEYDKEWILDSFNYTQIILTKDNLDMFTNPNTKKIFDQIGKANIYISGVASDYCVLAAINGLKKFYNYDLFLIKDAVEKVWDKDIYKKIEEKGVELINTNEFLKK